MGINPVRRLVVPRFLALVTIAPILIVVILVSGTMASYILAVTLSDVTPGSFWQSSVCSHNKQTSGSPWPRPSCSPQSSR